MGRVHLEAVRRLGFVEVVAIAGRRIDVVRSMAKWPGVPDVYGWLSLDRRGNFLIQNAKIGNRALREFISRNYQPDARGCWYFQNGPQRVFVALAYTPLVLHFEGEALFDHCGKPFKSRQAFLADRAQGLAGIARLAVPARFGFIADPTP